jgi:hypothetical protein
MGYNGSKLKFKTINSSQEKTNDQYLKLVKLSHPVAFYDANVIYIVYS